MLIFSFRSLERKPDRQEPRRTNGFPLDSWNFSPTVDGICVEAEKLSVQDRSILTPSKNLNVKFDRIMFTIAPRCRGKSQCSLQICPTFPSLIKQRIDRMIMYVSDWFVLPRFLFYSMIIYSNYVVPFLFSLSLSPLILARSKSVGIERKRRSAWWFAFDSRSIDSLSRHFRPTEPLETIFNGSDFCQWLVANGHADNEFTARDLIQTLLNSKQLICLSQEGEELDPDFSARWFAFTK